MGAATTADESTRTRRAVSPENDQETVHEEEEEEDASGQHENLSDSLLLMSLSQFYLQKGNIEKIIPVINCVSDVSLRLLDWFVTNYAKKKNIIITKPSPDGQSTSYFNVYLSYRAQLKAYSKQYFDPFRRRDRIEYYYAKDKSIQTTIGQLNFFKWVLQNDILEYIAEHAHDIETDMMRSKNRKKTKKKAEKEAAAAATATTKPNAHHPMNENGEKRRSPCDNEDDAEEEDDFNDEYDDEKEEPSSDSPSTSSRVSPSSSASSSGSDTMKKRATAARTGGGGGKGRGMVNHLFGLQVVHFD